MSIATLLIPAAFLYAGLVYWLLLRFNFKALWQDNGSPTPTAAGASLTGVVKRLLDFFLVLYLFLIVMWLPFIVVMALSQAGNPGWGFDIIAFSGFNIDINALAGVEFTGLRNPEISGKTSVNLDTSNLFAFYLFASSQLIAAITAFYGVVQLRALILSLRKGLSFTAENAIRIKRIGYVVLAWNLANPLMQYFGWGRVIQDFSFTTGGVQLYPAFEINGGGLFLATLLIVLSGVLREAAALSKEHELTI